MEKEIFQRGKELLEATHGENMSIFRRDYWNGKVMEWSMKNPAFKLNMFRFVDVLPVLASPGQIVQHFQEYMSHGNEDMPAALKLGLGTMGVAGISHIAAGTIKNNIMSMAKMFITGTTPEEAFSVYDRLRQQRICFTADILGEKVVCEEEAREYQRKYIDLFRALTERSKNWKDDPLMDSDHRGPIPKVNISVKPSSLSSQLSCTDLDHAVKLLKDSMRPIFCVARETGAFVHVDMEHYGLKDITLRAFMQLLEEEEFRTLQHVGIVIQAYLRCAADDVRTLIQWCRKQDRPPVVIRLVKGAYWDYETIMAKQLGWPCPVFTVKSHSDASFEAITKLILDNHQVFGLALGSHNMRSIAHAFVYGEKMKIPKGAIEVQMLYGMAEPIKQAMIRMGYRVRDYAPVGELIPGMAYLVRRLLENTANESFLRLKFTTDTPVEVLLRDPGKLPDNLDAGAVRFPPPSDAALDMPFVNNPTLDFHVDANRTSYRQALERTGNSLGRDVLLRIGGQEIRRDRKIPSINPCRPDQVIVNAHAATREDAIRSVDSAYEARKRWMHTPVRTRALALLKAADIMRQRRFDIAAWMTIEVGKTWKESDADVVEAIDFCEYYAREAVRLFEGRTLRKVPGEDNRYFYRPKGVGVVISPWNFPFAIPAGMVTAALVTGNPVVFKPAGQSVRIGEILYDILLEAGIPPDVLHFVPGSGSEIGPALAEHPKTAFIIFTGSMEVGTDIIQRAAKTVPGMMLAKCVVAEMGGKNACIIDEDADLDEAVAGTMYSAFGFQGQKCSALSRLIVHEAVYDRFMHRFREAMSSLAVGDARDPRSDLAAVIDKAAYDRIMHVIDDTKKTAARCTQAPLRELPDARGYFIPPTLFEGVARDSVVAQVEIFGPVVAAFKVKSVEEAVELANAVPYALTGGIYSRSPNAIEYVKQHYEAGNIYINRGITGAIVYRHPFGGYKLSGVGSKAGGPDYLNQFVDPVTTVENSIRRGFAPDVSE